MRYKNMLCDGLYSYMCLCLLCEKRKRIHSDEVNVMQYKNMLCGGLYSYVFVIVCEEEEEYIQMR